MALLAVDRSADGPNVAAVRARLADADRLDSPEGVAALTLAGLVDDGGHTASGAAALVRELRATLVEALAGAAVAADGLDDLARRRRDKAGA